MPRVVEPAILARVQDVVGVGEDRLALDHDPRAHHVNGVLLGPRPHGVGQPRAGEDPDDRVFGRLPRDGVVLSVTAISAANIPYCFETNSFARCTISTTFANVAERQAGSSGTKTSLRRALAHNVDRLWGSPQ